MVTAPKKRRRLLNGLFAAVFLLAAVGLTYLVLITVRGIPRDEAEQVGERQTRSLRTACELFQERLRNVAGVYHDVVAKLPELRDAAVLDDTNPVLLGALTRLVQIIGPNSEGSFRIVRVSETGERKVMYPIGVSSPPDGLTVDLAQSLAMSAKSVPFAQSPMPEPLSRMGSGQTFLVFSSPLAGKPGEPAKALCLILPFPMMLKDALASLGYGARSYFFLLSWAIPGGQGTGSSLPELLWISSESGDDPTSSSREVWRRDFLRRLGEHEEDLRADRYRYAFLNMPTKSEGDRLEIISHNPLFLRWGVCLGTPYDAIHSNAANQRVLLVTLGSVALGILAAAFLFFIFLSFQRERELKALESGYEGLFSENPTAMMVLDDVGALRDCNFSAAKLIGIPSREAREVKLTDVFEPERMRRLLDGLYESGSLHAFDVRLKRLSDNAAFLLEFWGRRITDRWILMANDVGERREFEQQIARLRRMDSMGALASTLAHDFNNLLGQIQILVSNVRADVDPESDLSADLAAIENKVEDATQLVGSILAFRDKVASNEPVALEPILRDFAQDLKKVLPESIEFQFHVECPLPTTWILGAALRRLLDNIIKNAVDAMPSGGRLTMVCGVRRLPVADPKHDLVPGEYALIAISDTGQGIRDEVLEKLFQPFFTTKRRGKGTGLGLWTVYRMLRQVGGGVSVQSQVGQGSRFEIFLPNHPPTAENSWIRKEKFE